MEDKTQSDEEAHESNKIIENSTFIGRSFAPSDWNTEFTMMPHNEVEVILTMSPFFLLFPLKDETQQNNFIVSESKGDTSKRSQQVSNEINFKNATLWIEDNENLEIGVPRNIFVNNLHEDDQSNIKVGKTLFSEKCSSFTPYAPTSSEVSGPQPTPVPQSNSDQGASDIPVAVGIFVATVVGTPVFFAAGIKLGMFAAFVGGAMGYTTGKMFADHE